MMDVNAALERLRVGVEAALSGELTEAEMATNAGGIAEEFQTLDNWLCSDKGFVPQDWR